MRIGDRYSSLKEIVVILPHRLLLLIDLPDRTSCFGSPMAPHTGGETFNRRMDTLAIPKAAPALLSEHFAPQFRLNQRLYSDDSIVS